MDIGYTCCAVAAQKSLLTFFCQKLLPQDRNFAIQFCTFSIYRRMNCWTCSKTNSKAMKKTKLLRIKKSNELHACKHDSFLFPFFPIPNHFARSRY